MGLDIAWAKRLALRAGREGPRTPVSVDLPRMSRKRHPVRFSFALSLGFSLACRCNERGAAIIAAARAIRDTPRQTPAIALDAARVVAGTVRLDAADAVRALKARVAALGGR